MPKTDHSDVSGHDDAYKPSLKDMELAVATLKDEIGPTYDFVRFREFVSANPVTRYLLKDYALGTIHWTKFWGSPGTQAHAAGFKVRHVGALLIPTPSGFSSKRIEHDEPLKWDAPEDDQYYRVNFLAWINRIEQNAFAVEVIDQEWENRPDLGVHWVYRMKSDPELRSFPFMDDFKVIDPFTISGIVVSS